MSTGIDDILSVRNLDTRFYVNKQVFHAVDDVSIDFARAKTIAIVGESGCGKTVFASSLLRIVPMPPGKITGGQVWFDEQDLLSLPEKKMQEIRGGSISMIFQEPMTSLNPVFRIGYQISEALLLHQYDALEGTSRRQKKRAAKRRAVELMDKVGIPDAKTRVNDFPHRLSGGMRQRVMIAMSLACNPAVLVADEPTTALDVTVQAQILDLLSNLQRDLHTTIVLITHDFGVVAEAADFVAVMYAGQIVEQASTAAIFASPQHPYTIGLLKSVPRIDKDEARLFVIDGIVPNSSSYPAGCRFAARCPYKQDICVASAPKLDALDDSRMVRCHFPGGVSA